MKTENANVLFRNAEAKDSHKVSELIYESSKDMFDYAYELQGYEPLEFIKYCVESGKGFLGYKKQTVGVLEDKVVFSATCYTGKQFLKLTWETLVLSFKYYGWSNGLKLLVRSSKIAHLFIKPKKDSIFLANICTDQSFRGTGIFKRFFEKLVNLMPSQSVGQIELDVSYSNTNAFAVYQKSGFRTLANCNYKGSDLRITGSYRMQFVP